MSDSKVLGTVLLIRHGDRQGFYQDPDSYTASSTAITALGAQQEYDLGQLLRSIYLNASSPSYIQNISTGVFKQSQVTIQADAGGEGGVIYDSAVALTQGLWPNTTAFNTTLANNSTVIISPLGGYQYIPIGSVNPNNDVSLEGWTSCGAFTNSTNDFYDSDEFTAKEKEADPFLQSLPQYLDGRNVSLENMWNIFDYMNVNNIHNSTFAKNIPAGYMNQARDLANWHEYNVFSDPSISGIGNIGGRTVLPSVLSGLQGIANSTNPVKLVINEVAYKPFLSLFNMTGVAQKYPELAGIVDYASAVALEVRSGSSEPVVRMNFKNGSADFKTYDLLGNDGDVPLSTFLNTLEPAAINNTAQWCKACSNQVDRGCAAFYSTEFRPATTASSHHSKVSNVGAGFIGAAVTIALFAAMFGVLSFLGFLTFGRRKSQRQSLRGAPRREDSYAMDEPATDAKVRD